MFFSSKILHIQVLFDQLDALLAQILFPLHALHREKLQRFEL
jgi:hypothetical protein